MNTSFYNGISGIKTQQFGLDVWANNIANIGTNGFLGKTPEFSTVFATTLTDSYFDSTSNDIGTGSTASAASLNTYTQGVFQPTDRVFDLALDGKGWFGVQSSTGETLYTRNGAFNIDANGDLVDDSGNFLLGTSGDNITPTTLSDSKLEKFGQYYNNGARELGSAFSIADIGDVTLSGVDTQNKINLPDILYYPPKATTYIDYQANLNPKVKTEDYTITLQNSDLTSNVDTTNNTINIQGTFVNATNLTTPKAGDIVHVTLGDDSNNTLILAATLDESLNFSINNEDISSLDPTSIVVKNDVKLTQEIPNVEHFTTEVISPEGGKNFVDMTFTKRTPQENSQTTWDADLELLSYVEEYKIETYDPTKSYDPAIYNVDLQTNQVTKIYDPLIYKVDTGSRKVYKIIDKQSGDATFAGNGELVQSNIPTLSNGGVPLSINIGNPYEEIAVANPTMTIANEQIAFSGNTTLLEAGKQINVKYTDPDGFERIATGKVEADGSWIALQKYEFIGVPTIINSYHIVNSGFDGMVSNVDLNKARVAQKDGKIEGFLKDYGMDGIGNVIAEFTNGESSAIAKIAVYHFRNPQGLSNVTSTLFSTTSNSGNALFYTDENGVPFLGAKIRPNNLEASNVSFNTALTELIITQKAFDASSKSITTSDQMIQNAINMKR